MPLTLVAVNCCMSVGLAQKKTRSLRAGDGGQAPASGSGQGRW